MALEGRVHLRAWLLEEVDSLLQEKPEELRHRAIDLPTALWQDVSVKELIREASFILPELSFRRFLNFAINNYPEEALSVQEQRVEDHAGTESFWPQYEDNAWWLGLLSCQRSRDHKWEWLRRHRNNSAWAALRGTVMVSRRRSWHSLHWLDTRPEIQVVFLQETHWGFDGDWTQGKWHFCNSAAERRRAGGVLVALRADVFPKEQIRWQTVEPGRLLHVRCFAEKQHLDLICFYQHALPFGVEQQKEVMTKRQNVWKKLDALLGSQPTKSSVMLAGDFNCVLPAMAPCIGVGIHNGPSAAHLVEERSKVASILRKHDLCVLNSWGRKHWTYTHPRGQSQIDYIAVRRCLADGKAKQATVQRTPLAGWRSSGHMPVQADIKLDWRPWKNSRAKPVLAPIVAKQAQNPDLHSLKQELLARRNPVAPPQRPALANVDGPVKTFWRCHAELARAKAQAPPSRLTFALIFERLRLHSRMQAAHKALKRASRARKRQQQLDILQIAEHAARCGNSKELFQCVRWLVKSARSLQNMLKHCSEADLAAMAHQLSGISKASTADALLRASHHCQEAHLTAFADDTHGFWTVCNASDFQRARTELKAIIDALQCMGMTINFTKSMVVILLRGKAAPGLYKRFFRLRHGTQNLRLASEDSEDVYLPCANTLDYLGVVLAYDNFEGRTVQHRADKAEATYNQLRKVLRSNGALTAPYRLRIFNAIVVSSLIYGLVSVGVTAEVVRKVSSDIAGHLRKVLRIYEHGVTNQEVLRRAGLSPIAMLNQRAHRLREHILHDQGRADGLRRIELERVQDIIVHLEELIAKPPGLTLQHVSKAEVCAVSCPVCGLEYNTGEGLSMHLHRRHPEVQENSRQALDRQQHALFGVPVCRFCHVRACDWSALRKHIEEGHCRWIQAKVAAGHTTSELLAIIEQEEACKPPKPPDAVLADSALQDARDLLGSSNDKLVQIGPQLRGLARQCILCAQRVQYSVLRQSGQEYQGARFSTALFQFLAGRDLQRGSSTLNEAAQATFSAPQARKASTPKQRLIADMFGRSKSAAKSSVATHAEIAQAIIVEPPQNNQPPPPAPRLDVNVPASPAGWVLSLVLSNPHNHCYANAGMLALFAAWHWTPRLSIQDTIEFITLLLQAARVEVGRWESRIDSHASIEVYTRGAGPIALPAQGNTGDLQEAINAWHQQGSVHALCNHPDIILVYLARYVGNGKSFKEVFFHEEVKVPVFVQEMQVEWREYQPVSAVLHFGATPVAGHYRSLLKIKGQWYFTQDGVVAKSQGLLRQHRKKRLCNLAPAKSQRRARTFRAISATMNALDSPEALTNGSEASTKDSEGGSKKPRVSSGRGGQKRQWQQAQQQQWSGWDSEAKEDLAAEIARLKACIAQLQRLALRHEDSINIGKIEVSWVAHFRIDAPNSIVKCIFVAADGWKKARDSDPASISKPLRSTLLACVFMELRTRVQEMNEEQAKALQTLGWYDMETKVRAYLRWNPISKALEKDTKRSGATTEALFSAIEDITRAIPQQHAVARFHPTRPLAAEMRGESVTFLVQFGQQNDHAERICSCIPVLCSSAVTQLICMSIKPERLQRSNLANQISEAYIE
ncbi:hypothetical protein AK812_SmicGene37250 [Symbiodinium microadriaticum]|uniref:C2H2-type domain-containing protein n=1 Tax=Symbiodinium microadriaticum TaxID=2951 RepID=A0A1Q9CGS7_SYMMI|nr:hypothetical protein AK812_SmicGene37250 [Symbiodinium microadriaticum]